MKPDWKDAPEWAQWLGMDLDGAWWWFASAPAKHENGWMPKPKTLCRIASEPELNWRETLEQRPE
jgi:hypothetical protein